MKPRMNFYQAASETIKALPANRPQTTFVAKRLDLRALLQAVGASELAPADRRVFSCHY